MFAGVHTALVTPFRDGALDVEAYKALIDAQFAGGVAGIVPAGTTGESPTLTHEEHQRVIEVGVELAKGRGLVIAGTGSNSTAEAISLTQAAERAGADAALLVSPYYNKPSQEGIFQHYKAIADATKLPLVLYSIPGRCVVEIGVETMARLAEACPNIRAVKEAGGSVERVMQIRAALPEDFEIVSGDDSLTLPFMAVGASGVISVASNLIPQAMTDLVSAMLKSDLATANEIQSKYYGLFSAFLKLATNPVPIKTAMELTGAMDGALRRHSVSMEDSAKAELEASMVEAGVLK